MTWSEITDPSTAEDIEVEYWSESQDLDLVNIFRQLLSKCVQDDLAKEMHYLPSNNLHYFKLDTGSRGRRVDYKSLVNRSSLSVVHDIGNENNPTFRHLGMSIRFDRFGSSQWYGVISPDYVFTVDGRELLPWSSKLVSGIRRLERNRTVLSQVQLLHEFITSQRPMFDNPRWVSFGDLEVVDSPVSVPLRHALVPPERDQDIGGDEPQQTLDFGDLDD